MAYKVIGSAIAEWDDTTPFTFYMSEEVGDKDSRTKKTYTFNLSNFRDSFEDDFLLNLKDHLIERRNKVLLITIWTEYCGFLSLLRNTVKHDLFEIKVSIIDETFLLALNTITEEIPKYILDILITSFKSNPYSSIFSNGIRVEDFPRKKINKPIHAKSINNILVKAIKRSTCVEILRLCEQSYEDGEIDIGHFSFINLAFAVYVRPESYRKIKLNDLVYDIDEDAFFIYISRAKLNTLNPQKICYRINNHVGILLQKQRQQVIEQYAHIVEPNEVGNLALFPYRKPTNHHKSELLSKNAQQTFGEMPNGGSFSMSYFAPIEKIVKDTKTKLGSNVLRHTIGTQLALSGCSAKTIQAVLKHASDTTCQAYVDIAFQGLVNELSDAMQPAFEAHMPVFQRFRSKDDPVKTDKVIYSEDINSGHIEMTGECGKNIRCQAAPFTCYECNKFIPCFDVDHSVSLDIIQNEISKYNQAGMAYQHLLEKAKMIKHHIQIVMAACDRYRQAFPEQERS